ncbi:MAG: zinc-binding alcohol dehydrogenase [Gammaproteobacteria bacterium]|nr:zinc-binding alcohol dehydrogenase [Gammaproteobacteria bacterium]
MKIRQLWFTDSHKVEIRESQLDSLRPDQVLVKNLYSAISSGTELLLYRGQIPDSLALDENLEAYKHADNSFPLQYGYSSVGIIEDIGKEVGKFWQGKTVFGFQPHASHTLCNSDQLLIVPEDVDPQAAVFFANMETAVNLVHDGNPRLGDKCVVIGQGIIGLLTTSLLRLFPLAGNWAVENLEMRQEKSKQLGISGVYSSIPEQSIDTLKKQIGIEDGEGGADIVFELSGSPAALNLALELTAYGGRIVVGSWYGNKTAEISLGEKFHRNRISIISSQVSTIAPEISGRWNKPRRYEQTWEMLKKVKPQQFISHAMSIDSAAEAYQLLDKSPEQALQVVFDYLA